MLEKHDELSARMDRLEVNMLANTAITQDIKSDTAEFLEIFKAMKGGVKTLGWLGNLAKWLAGLGAAFVGLYYSFKGPHA